MGKRIENELQRERRARGWSQQRLAAAAGITRQSYAAIEAGEAVPATDVALRLAQVLGRTVEALFRLPDVGGATTEAEWAGGGPIRPVRVRLARVAGRRLAYPLTGAAAFGTADGVAAEANTDRVRLRLLKQTPPEPALVILGCDPAFAVVAEALRQEWELDLLWLQRGSRAALEALARGEAHVAGIHLFDPDSGEYNGPWLRRLVPFPCTRVRFAVWEQALIVGRGNPLGLSGVADLARPNLRFLNREPGSGSRVLLDEELRRNAIPATAVPGYDAAPAGGHLAVAEAIACGLADVGVGIRAAAAIFGADAVLLAFESYDLVIPDHFLDLPAVQALLTALRTPSTRAQVEQFAGYDVAFMGQPV